MYPSFTKACQAFFGDERKITIPEFKELNTQDKIELSTMLNALPAFTHPQYVPTADKSPE